MTIATELPAVGQTPFPAPLMMDCYAEGLTALRTARTRAEAADVTQMMASSADGIAAALTGSPDAEPDTDRDPVAWTDTATYLTRIALALRGALIDPDDARDFSDDHYGAWEDLSGTCDRREFAAAWQTIKQTLQEYRESSEENAQPRLRVFAVGQVLRVAAAVIDAPW